MREVSGKAVCDTMEELLDPKRCALVVIDMQKGGFGRGPADYKRSGHDLSGVEEIAPRCRDLIDAARATGVLVAHIRVANLPGQTSSSPAWLRSLTVVGKQSPIDPGNLSIEGTWQTEFIEECTPLPGELVITKHRSSAFVGTELALLLRSSGIETVAVIGIATPGCVAATIRDAAHLDFYNVLIEDCVAGYNRELHDAALTVLRARHDHTTAADATRIWEAAAMSAGA
jgi:nicotinamidase-related amidase